MSKLDKILQPAERRDSSWGDQDTETQADPQEGPGTHLDTFRAIPGGGGSLACFWGPESRGHMAHLPAGCPGSSGAPGWPLAPGDRA